MALTKRCFVCAHKENDDGSCTNENCPRYVAQAAADSTDTVTTDTETK